MALEELGIVPSKILNLRAEKDTVTAEIANRIKKENPDLKGKFFNIFVKVNTMWEKHKLYEDEVLGHFGDYVSHIDVTDRSKQDVVLNLRSQVGLLFNKTFGRRPPGIVLLGPSGSGRSTQAKLVAKHYGLVRVSVRDTLQKHSITHPEVG